MAARDLLTRTTGRVRRWLAADRTRAIHLALAAAVLAASTVWFVTARDDRGRTARLTADAWYYHAYLPSLVFDRDLDFADEYRITNNWYRFGKTDTGRYANVFGIGPAVFEMPLFLAGHGIARAAGAEADGFSRPEVELGLYASLLASLAALLFAHRLLRRRLGGRWGPALVPLVLACAGPVVYYAIRQPGYAHPFATFWVAWLVDAWDASFDGADRPRSLRRWLGLGALLGASALARPQCVLWGVILVPAAIDDLRRADGWVDGLRTCAPRWLAGAAVSVLVFLPQPLAWDAIYGGYLVTPQGEGFMRWDSPAWSEVLFSSRNGLFPWAPLYAIAAVGLLASVRRTPRVTGALVAGVVLQTVTNGAVWDWWAGGSFGGRRFDSTFIAFAYGLGHLFIRPAPWRPVRWWLVARRLAVGTLAAIALVLVAGNLGLAARHSAPTVRIHGGAPASRVLRAALGPVLGPPVAALSAAANFPARLAFAIRHDTDLDAYDHLVGEHTLGELYPGLNSFRGKNRERISLADPDAHRLLEVEPGSRSGTTAVGDRPARVLVGLNRLGPVTLRLQAAAPDGRERDVTLRWNGRPIGSGTVGPRGGVVEGQARHVRRGTNELVVEATPGTLLYWLEVSGPRDPRGR